MEHMIEEIKWKHLYRKAQLLFFSEWKTLLISMAAIVIYAVGVVGFTIPYKFADQGVMGIAVLLKYTLGLNPAYVLLVLNIILLAWGARTLSKRFLIWTVINAFVLSAVLDILQTINFPIMDDIFLVAVAGGVIKGLGIGLLYREGISAGGLDIAISVLKKRYGMEVGRLSFYFNMVILAVSFSIIGLEKVMYGFISCYICGMTIDSVLASFDKRRDGFTIMCLLMPRQVVELKRFLAEHFPSSFMVVTEANEVVGKGFKRWRNI